VHMYIEVHSSTFEYIRVHYRTLLQVYDVHMYIEVH
jgi:hypothetical protein